MHPVTDNHSRQAVARPLLLAPLGLSLDHLYHSLESRRMVIKHMRMITIATTRGFTTRHHSLTAVVQIFSATDYLRSRSTTITVMLFFLSPPPSSSPATMLFIAPVSCPPQAPPSRIPSVTLITPPRPLSAATGLVTKGNDAEGHPAYPKPRFYRLLLRQR